MAPFLSGGGYSSEAWAYILSLNKTLNSSQFRLSIEHHGDAVSQEFWMGLPPEERELAVNLHQELCLPNETIVICHSEPGAWHPPLFQTSPCPPLGYSSFIAVVGRTMFETDRLTTEHVARCNRMDYVWVPSQFHVSSFVESGVQPSKVVKVVQPVDVEFFNPEPNEPLNLKGELVLGKRRTKTKEFVFLSIFKWEDRKGWDVLIKAYVSEFTGGDEVALVLMTKPYHSEVEFSGKISQFVSNCGIREPAKGWPSLYVISSHIAQVEMPRLYKSADAFVLASRGEGWGRPLAEAMAMGLPVIATNWSGPTEFISEENSYPLKVEKMVEVKEGPFKGHLWAEPSVDHLRDLMRRIVEKRGEGEEKGRKARKLMVEKFSPEIVARVVIEALHAVVDSSDTFNGV